MKIVEETTEIQHPKLSTLNPGTTIISTNGWLFILGIGGKDCVSLFNPQTGTTYTVSDASRYEVVESTLTWKRVKS